MVFKERNFWVLGRGVKWDNDFRFDVSVYCEIIAIWQGIVCCQKELHYINFASQNF
jgi:hypothetical protein